MSWNTGLQLANILKNVITNPFDGNLSIGGNLDVSGALIIDGSFNHTGPYEIDGNFTQTGGTSEFNGEFIQQGGVAKFKGLDDTDGAFYMLNNYRPDFYFGTTDPSTDIRGYRLNARVNNTGLDNGIQIVGKDASGNYDSSNALVIHSSASSEGNIGISTENCQVNQDLSVNGVSTFNDTITLTGGVLEVHNIGGGTNSRIELKGDTNKSAYIDFGQPSTQDYQVRTVYNPVNNFFKFENDDTNEENSFLIDGFKNIDMTENYMVLRNPSTGGGCILNPQAIGYWNGSTTATHTLLASTSSGNVGFYDRKSLNVNQLSTAGNETNIINWNPAFSHYKIIKNSNGNKTVQFYITVNNATSWSETIKVMTYEGAGYSGSFDIRFNLVNPDGTPYSITDGIGVTANCQNTFGALTARNYTQQTPLIAVDNDCFCFDIQVLGTVVNPLPLCIIGIC